MNKEQSVVEASRRYPNLVIRLYYGQAKPYYSRFDDVPVDVVDGDPVVLVCSYQAGFEVGPEARHMVKQRELKG